MGQPAARVGDMHVCPMVTPAPVPVPHVGGPILPPGGITVLIGGMPAAVVGNMCVCVGPPDVIVKGSLGVFICGMPAARMGDMTAHGGTIVLGFPTVLIGDIGGGGGSAGGGSVSASLGVILNQINAGGGTENCGNIIDGVVAALSGRGVTTVTTDGDGSFEAINARLGSNVDFSKPTTFDAVFADLKKSGPGSMMVIGVEYSADGGSHVIIAANVDGQVGIMEGQNWGEGQPAGFITDPAVANARYNTDGNSTIAASPVTITTSEVVPIKASEAGNQKNVVEGNPQGGSKRERGQGSEMDEHFASLENYREEKGLPVQDRSGPAGTVAKAHVNGKEIFGHNSTMAGYSLSVEERRTVFADMQKAGFLSDLDNLGRAQFLSHAEAEVIIKTYEEVGNLPESLTIYCDRATCPNCREYLEELVSYLGGKEVNIIYKTENGPKAFSINV